tara:strand:- start:996 stop:1406 length:411 start_codon:yes stop_codon:yes gene_type:complete
MTVSKIKIFKNKVIKNENGNLIKYISKKNYFFKKFGEVYFNHIKFKKKKGWIKHKKNNCLIQCVVGRIQFHFIDSKKKQRKINLDSNSGKILLIPPKIWFSFTSLKKTSILVNMIEKPHSDKEVLKNSDINKILNV